jgi:flagellar protein FlaJ
LKLAGSKQKKKVEEESVGQLHVYSYKLLNDHVKFLHPKLTSLDKSIKQSMMPIPFEVYVSSMVFFSMIAGICGMVMGVIALQFINIQPASLGFILPLLSGLMLFGMTFGILQMIPAIKVKNRSAKLIEEIPHFIGYMSTLATSGLF